MSSGRWAGAQEPLAKTRLTGQPLAEGGKLASPKRPKRRIARLRRSDKLLHNGWAAPIVECRGIANNRFHAIRILRNPCLFSKIKNESFILAPFWHAPHGENPKARGCRRRPRQKLPLVGNLIRTNGVKAWAPHTSRLVDSLVGLHIQACVPLEYRLAEVLIRKPPKRASQQAHPEKRRRPARPNHGSQSHCPGRDSGFVGMKEIPGKAFSDKSSGACFIVIPEGGSDTNAPPHARLPQTTEPQ